MLVIAYSPVEKSRILRYWIGLLLVVEKVILSAGTKYPADLHREEK
jgi:hypothetical protein